MGAFREPSSAASRPAAAARPAGAAGPGTALTDRDPRLLSRVRALTLATASAVALLVAWTTSTAAFLVVAAALVLGIAALWAATLTTLVGRPLAQPRPTTATPVTPATQATPPPAVPGPALDTEASSEPTPAPDPAPAAVADHDPGGVLAQVVRERDQLEAQLRELQSLATHDSVTGLGNRLLLDRRGAELGSRLPQASLLLLDLDGFKAVNDSLGHALGDDLLRAVGERLGRCVRPQDTVARLGGDEFVVLLPDGSGWHAAQTADRMLEAVRLPYAVSGQTVQLRGSVGIAHATDTSSLGDLLQRADVAMYAAKSAGRDRYREFHDSMSVDTAARFRFDAEMRQALLRGDFAVYYQPLVDARSHTVVSLEALVRWEHRGRGVLPPAEFLEASERSGLIVELGQHVLRTACEQIAVWRRTWPWLTVAVNVSHRELMGPEFAPQVAGIMASTGVPAEALWVEVTETILAEEDVIQEILQPLTALGVRCALDDFGTGHSSLSRLGRLSVDRVKIDRSFVMDVHDDTSPGAPLLASIVDLAHSVGLGVVAEGVETLAQAEFLAARGCEELQGYYFSRAVSAQDVPTVMASGTTPPVPAAALAAPGASS